MKNIKKVSFSIFLLLASVVALQVNAASIKDNSDDFTGDVYIMGGTKFTRTVTSDLAFDAGLKYSDLLDDFPDLYEDQPIKTYYYNHAYKKWYVVPRNGGPLESTTSEEKEYLKNDLYTFYENDEEKIIEFDPGIAISETFTDYEDFGVKYENGKFKIPATVTSFPIETRNGEFYWVDTNYDVEEEEMEYGEFYIPGTIYVYDYRDKNAVLSNPDDVNYIRNQFTLTKEGYLKLYDEEELYHYYGTENEAVIGYVDENGNPIDMMSKIFNKDEKVYRILDEAAIRVGSRNYTIDDIDKAIEDSDNGFDAALLTTPSGKTVVNKLVTLDKENINMNLNLNGQTLSRNNGSFVIYQIGKNSTLNIYNGKIENETGQAITVGQSSKDAQNIDLHVDSTVIINTKGIGIAVMGNKANLTFNGTINLLKEGASGITGRGNEDDAGANIYLYNANIYSDIDKTVGLYLPHEGNTQINYSNITAGTPIGIKAGKLYFEESHLYAIGTKNDPVLNNNGVNSTGDAIYVEMNEKYLDNIEINVDMLSSLNSVNGKPILVYNPDNKMDEPTIEAENYRTIDIDGDKTYYSSSDGAVISVGNKLYTEENIAQAILLSSENNPAKLMKNFRITGRINLELNDQDVYLDLNEKELICGKECIRTTGINGSLSISNGILRTTAEGGQALTIGKYRETIDKNMTLNLSNDVTIYAIGHGIAVFGNGTTLNSSANINVETLETDLTGIYGITGNGLDNDGTTINITGGTIRTLGTNTAALYLPQLGTTKIENARLEGESAIGIKSGTLEIKNSKLYATVSKRDANSYNNGIYPTGDTIFVELNSNYQDNVEIFITGSELGSVANVGDGESYGDAILIYNPEAMDEIKITAPDYSTKIIKENGKKVYYQSTENALMTVGNVGYTFANFKEAIDASSEETPLILKNDYVISAEETLNIGSGKSFKTAEGVKLIVQGILNMTSDAIIDLKLEMNGGTVISGGIPITGPENSAYITYNATYYLDTNRNIEVLSGNVLLGMSFNTMLGQTLVIKEGTTFEIPEDKTLNLYSNLTIENGATFIVNGTMNIYEGGKVTGTYTTGENGNVETVTN